jgi:hypothetical protein
MEPFPYGAALDATLNENAEIIPDDVLKITNQFVAGSLKFELKMK